MLKVSVFDEIKAPLSHYLHEVLLALGAYSNPNLSHSYGSGSGNSLDIARLLKILHDNIERGASHGKHDDILCRKYVVRPTLWYYVRYLQGARNKYAHEQDIPADEQLADLIICQRLVRSLQHWVPTLEREYKELNMLFEQKVKHYLDRVAEAYEVKALDPEPSQVEESLAALDHWKEEMVRLVASITPINERSFSDSFSSWFAELYEQIRQSKLIMQELIAHQEELRKSIEFQLYRVETVVELAMTERATSGTAHPNYLSVAESGDQPTFDEEPALRHDTNGEENIETNSIDNSSTLRTEEFDSLLESLLRTESSKPPKLTRSEVRGRLIDLRWRIWQECGTGPSESGLLRKRMLDHLIYGRVTNMRLFELHVPWKMRHHIHPQELKYLPEVFAIIERME